LRYEEIALAFDDEDASPDSPTFEAHALPSEAVLVARGSFGEGANHAEPNPARTVPPPRIHSERALTRAWRSSSSVPIVVLAIFALLGVVAALLAALRH
jgi:hypothetical protein